MEYHIDKNELTFNTDGGGKVKCIFDWPIVEVLQCLGVIIVRLEPAIGSCFNENVFGVDFKGQVIWQVAPQVYSYDDSPYTGMVPSDSKVTLMNWDGLKLEVDPLTGKVLASKQGK